MYLQLFEDRFNLILLLADCGTDDLVEGLKDKVDETSWKGTALAVAFKLAGSFIIEEITPEETTEQRRINMSLLPANSLAVFFIFSLVYRCL